MWEDVRRCEKMWEDVRRCEKMWEDVRRCEKMWEDVRRCEDEKMRRRWEDEKMWRWEDVKMRRCEDVKMRRCEDERMWRWEDVKMRGCEDERMWRWEDVKMRRCFTGPHYWKNPALRRSREKHGTRNFGSEDVWIHDFSSIILPRHLWRLPVPADAATAWLRPQRASSRASGGVCSLIGSVVQKWGLNQLSSWWFPICITHNPVVPLMYCWIIYRSIPSIWASNE